MQIAIGLYEGFTALDAVGPYQVFGLLPGTEVVFCAEQTGPVTDDLGTLHLQVDATFEEVTRPEVVMVPGGPGAGVLAEEAGPVVDWVRATHEHATWTASVCTGSLVLAAAGVLDDRRATTHWFAHEDLRAYGAEPTRERVVFDGAVATSAGITAGIDLALALAGRIAGEEAARSVQLLLEYDPRPPYDTGTPATAPAGLREQVSGMAGEVFERAGQRMRRRVGHGPA